MEMMITSRQIISMILWTIIVSIVLQFMVYLIGAITCELIGVQAQNPICNVYFQVETAGKTRTSLYGEVPPHLKNFDQPSGRWDLQVMDNLTTRRWCLIWREGNNRGHGVQCVRADRLLSWIGHSDSTLRKFKFPSTPVPKLKKPDPTVTLPTVEKFSHLMPLIKLNEKAFQPKIWVSRQRQRVRLVVSLSTSKSSGSLEQLFNTLDSLVLGLPLSDQHMCLILVYIAEVFDDTYTDTMSYRLLIRYNVQIDTGLIEIIVPREIFYAPLYENSTVMPSKRRLRPRKKQCMDHIYMMLQGHYRGEYYLQLGDAVLAQPNYFVLIQKILTDHASLDWALMRLSPSAVIGKLFHTSDLPDVVKYLARLDLNKPVSFHLESYLIDRAYEKQKSTKSGMYPEFMAPIVEPFLFQYAARRTPENSKTDQDHDATKTQNSNPRLTIAHSKGVPSYVPCSTIRFTDDLLPVLIPGRWPYKLVGAASGGRIAIKFTTPLKITKIKLVTGLRGVKRSMLGEDSSVWVLTPKEKIYNKLGDLSSDGGLEMTLPTVYQYVHVLTIVFGKIDPNQEIYLSELTLAMTCHQSTRTHVMSTTTITSVSAPAWYKQIPPKLPRREHQVLISY